jgi:hypothetical protein
MEAIPISPLVHLGCKKKMGDKRASIRYDANMPASKEWFLRKSPGGEVFGPIALEDLKSWVAESKISPMDNVSSDGQQSWIRTPMVPELQMDWLIDMPDNTLYGPTSVSTIQEFLARGEIDENVIVINTLDRSSGRLADQTFYSDSPHGVRTAKSTLRGAQWPQTAELTHQEAVTQRRLLWLEKQVMELQHQLGMAELYQQSLKAQFREATGRDPI